MQTPSQPSATAGTRLKQAELARALGVTRQYVGKLVARGVLQIDQDMRIDIDAARAAIAGSTDLSKLKPDQGRAIDDMRRAAQQNAAPPSPQADEAPAVDLQGGKLVSYQAAKTVRENYEAGKARLAYEQATGRLLDRSAVERALHDTAVATRTALERMPDKLASLLAAEPDPNTVHAHLCAAIDEILEDLAAVGSTLIDSLTSTHQ